MGPGQMAAAMARAEARMPAGDLMAIARSSRSAAEARRKVAQHMGEIAGSAAELDRYTAAIAAVSALHQVRTRTRDGFTEQWCVECRQDWPCPTGQAVGGILNPVDPEAEPF